MFYSQFILAKKGPLGTIWIAAHLERKLKKNQVADTDIGVSVDSILSPEVPIALRLSSHLLLGVVRIYSRKVNYLFHDCSEALLKAKQAFRSNAVDLPPEESTAPYHSITLPETFDLDDFELPDSALLHSNFDDRHVSTREQITLHDTLDLTGYPTSQFGLDERFGDGDASQIGLDIDEELLLDNNLTLKDASVLDCDMHQGEGATDLAKMVIEEGHHGGHGDRNDEASKELSELLGSNRGEHVLPNVENVHRNADSSQRLIFNIQTPDLNEVFLPDDHDGGQSVVHDINMDVDTADPPSPEFNQSAIFPSTPGLLEEAIEVRSQELPASNPQNISPYTTPEIDKLDPPLNQEVECTDVTIGPINAVSANPKLTNLAQVVSSPTSVLGEPKPDSDVPINGVGQNQVENMQSNSSTLGLTEPMANSLASQFSREPVAASCSDSALREADTLHTRISGEEANGQPASMDYSVVSGIAPQFSGEPVAASGSDSALREADTLHTRITSEEANGQPASMDYSVVLGIAPQFSGEPVAASGSDSILREADTLHTRITSDEANGQPASMDYSVVSGIAPQFSSEPVAASGSDSAFREADTLHTRITSEEANGLPAYMDYSVVSEIAPQFSREPVAASGSDSALRELHTRITGEEANGQPAYMDYSAVSGIAPQFSREPVAASGSDSALSEVDALHTRISSEEANGQPASMDYSVVSGIAPQFPCESVAASGSNSALREADTLHTRITSEEANGPPVSMDYSVVSGIASTIVVQHEDTTRISNLEQGGVEDANAGQSINFSAFHLRPCTSASNQANLLSSWNMVQESAQGVRPCSLETSMVDREMPFSGYSADLQGFHSVISTETKTNLGVDHNSNDVFIGLQSGVSNPIDLSTYCNPKDVHSGHWTCFSSSEFSQPERMRFVASGNVNMSNDLGQRTTEKGVIESDGSVDRISNLSGQKRRLADITPNMQNDILPKMSGIPRKKWNGDYIPNNDDLLESILVGRMTPAVRIGSTPPLPKPPSLKRHRLTAKAGFPKRRKVLLDDTTVLHADAIRQQLINTDDIRRIRKKAPCTRPEIWRIQKSSLEDDIFCESLFTGVCGALNRLPTRTYDPAQNIHSQVNAFHASGEASKAVELSKSSVFRDRDGQEMAKQYAVALKGVGDEMQVAPAESELIGVASYKNAVSFDGQEQLESPLDLQHVDIPHNTISRAELDVVGHYEGKDLSNAKTTSTMDVIGHSGIVPVTDAASNPGIEQKRDDLCTDRDQNPLNKAFQTSEDLLEVNNNILQAADDTSFEDLAPADCAGEAGVVSNNVAATIDNEISLEGKDLSNAKTTSTMDVIGHSGIVPVTDAASNPGIEQKRDDLCTDRDQNSLNKAFQTSEDLLEVNNNILQAADNTSFEDLAPADCAGEAGVVSNNVTATIDNEISLEGKDLSNAKTTSTMDVIGHSGIVPVTDAASNPGIEQKRDDLCTDRDQNSLNKAFQTSEDLLEVNNNILHAADDTSFEDLAPADRAGEAGVVSNNVSATIDNEISLEGKDLSNAKTTTTTVEDMGVDVVNLDCPPDGPANQDASVPGMVLAGNGPVTIDYQAMNDSEAGKVTEDERHVSELPGGERSAINSLPVPPCTESEHVPLAVGENSFLNIDGGLDVERNPMEIADTRESTDFCGAIDDIDTDFLNVDDDVVEYEEANVEAQNTENSQSLENSGWSSRTRGVARYLKNMFDQESGRGRKSVAIDHLLVGKTRKEASRMFFEALVLKTKDFIHVEQENAFDCINIQPRIKLLKSEF